MGVFCYREDDMKNEEQGYKFPRRFVGSYPLPFCRCQGKSVNSFHDRLECPLCGKIEKRKPPKRVLVNGQWIDWVDYSRSIQ